MSVTARPNAWLQSFARSYHFQFGEDGIVEKVFELLPRRNGWCVEFGAWDGRLMSNTCHWITRHGYAAVLVEADPSRFQALCNTYRDNPRVTALNRLVGWGPEDNLDALLAPTGIPADFDLLSVDIDGNDYHVWEAVTAYRPKVVVIEFNPTIPDEVDFVQDKDPRRMDGCSLLALWKLARRKGYEPVATTFCNAVFVDASYYPLFGIADNSVGQLRADRSQVTYLFHGHDGTVFLRGARALFWHDLPLHEACFQVLPRALRKFHDQYSDAERRLFVLFRELYVRLLPRDPQAARRLTTLGETTGPIDLDPAERALWQALEGALREKKGEPVLQPSSRTMSAAGPAPPAERTQRTQEPPTSARVSTVPKVYQGRFPLRLRDRVVEVPFLLRGQTDKEILYEVWEMDAYGIRGITEPPAIVVDIGAHTGAFAIMAAAAWPQARVFACECDPDNFLLPRKNLSGWPNVEAIEAAIVGDDVAKVEFNAVLDKSGHNSGGSCVHGLTESVKIWVRALSPAKLWESRGISRCDFLKLDCEGAEIPILWALARGGLLAGVARIVGEYHVVADRGQTPDSVEGELKTILEATHAVRFHRRAGGDLGYFVAQPIQGN
jgi:FkbM family methyltransferase